MKSLGFTTELKEQILHGKKNSTWRVDTTKDIQVGDEIGLIESATEQIFAHAVVTDIVKKKVKEITEEDVKGRNVSKDEMYDDLTKFYPDMQEESVITIFTFVVTEK